MFLISIVTHAQTCDVPIEKQTFYTDNIVVSTQSNKQTRAASNTTWETVSVVENCFDQANIGESAWLMTSDGETQLSVTLKYNGDDSRYRISSQEVEFYFYEGSDLFHDDNKEKITDIERFIGTYTKENTEKSATVKLTAPKNFPYTSSPYYTFYVVIKVKFMNGGTASVAKNIGVSRPGIIILHGLNDSSSTFQPMKNYFVSSGAFAPYQILTKDYSATNTSSFYANTHQNQVVKIGLYELSNSLFNVGIASTKYDMIGHSMGGILERLYNQEVDNQHTNKLITLNTPHFGAPLGNVAPSLFDAVNLASYTGPVWSILRGVVDANFNPGGGREAVSDLAIGSSAIQNLGNKAYKLNGIPVFAVGTYFSDFEENDYVYSDPSQITEESAYLLAHIFYNDVPRKRHEFLLDKVIGDGIVSLESQKGGLSDYYYSMFCDAWKGVAWSNAFHCNSPKWEVTQNELRLLLLSDADEYNFCMSGFGQQASTRSSVSSKTRSSDNGNNYITDFSDPNEGTFIKLSIEKVEKPDYTHMATISHSNDMETTAVFAVLPGDRMISDYDKTEMNFNLKDYSEDITFYAIGRTNYHALVVDSVKVQLGESDGVRNILRDSKLSIKYNNASIQVLNTNSSYSILITDSQGKTILSQRKNNSNSYSLPYPKGIYIVKITEDDGNVSNYKLLISK